MPWLDKLFEVKIKPKTITKRAERKIATNVASARTARNDDEIEEKPSHLCHLGVLPSCPKRFRPFSILYSVDAGEALALSCPQSFLPRFFAHPHPPGLGPAHHFLIFSRLQTVYRLPFTPLNRGLVNALGFLDSPFTFTFR